MKKKKKKLKIRINRFLKENYGIVIIINSKYYTVKFNCNF